MLQTPASSRLSRGGRTRNAAAGTTSSAGRIDGARRRARPAAARRSIVKTFTRRSSASGAADDGRGGLRSVERGALGQVPDREHVEEGRRRAPLRDDHAADEGRPLATTMRHLTEPAIVVYREAKARSSASARRRQRRQSRRYCPTAPRRSLALGDRAAHTALRVGEVGRSLVRPSA